MSGTFFRAGPQRAADEKFPTPWLQSVLFAALMIAITGAAAALRLTDLGNRPMHCDEAVHAIKFGRLLEQDDYVYDPREYHGPSLSFLTLPIARSASAQKLTQITETHLRLLPAIFGIGLVALVWLIRDELGRPAALCAAVLTAVSPAMVFYSRYYIQEMLLVSFTFGAIVAWGKVSGTFSARAKRSPAPVFWLVLLGLCIGMMHASKETCVIALAAMALAAGRKGAGVVFARPPTGLPGKRLPTPLLLVVLTAGGVSMLFFSSFLDNPRGVLDSVTTYFVYLGRSSGEGSVGRHVYPWHYYLQVLFWWHRGDGPVWTEASIALLASVGLVAAFVEKGLNLPWVRFLLKPIAALTSKGLSPENLPLARFLGAYTVVMTVVYCALPYKTPWCALGFLHGMILLAGVGAMVLVRAAPGHAAKAIVIAALVAAAGHLAWQAWRASFAAYEDPHNPYVYAHTTNDVPPLARRVEQIAAVHGDGKAMHVQVICPDDDYWPLPWYLRRLGRVGWFGQVPEGPAAPLIITQPEMEPSLLKYLYLDQPPGQRHLYVPLAAAQEGQDWQLRPHVPLRAYVRLQLWEAYLAAEPEEVSPAKDVSTN